MEENKLVRKLSVAAISDYFITNVGSNATSIRPTFVEIFENLQKYVEEKDINGNGNGNDIKTHLKKLKEVYEGNEYVHDMKYINNGPSGHATFQIIHRNKGKFDHYFFNSGAGIDFKMNDNLLHYFKYSNTGELNPVLFYRSKEEKEIKKSQMDGNEYYETYLKEYKPLSNNKSFFIEQQLIGNCVLRSLLYPIFIIIKLLDKKVNNDYLSYLVKLVRFYIIYYYLGINFSDENYELSFDDKISLEFFKSLIVQENSNYEKANNFYSELLDILTEEIKSKIDKFLKKPLKKIKEISNTKIYNTLPNLQQSDDKIIFDENISTYLDKLKKIHNIKIPSSDQSNLDEVGINVSDLVIEIDKFCTSAYTDSFLRFLEQFRNLLIRNIEIKNYLNLEAYDYFEYKNDITPFYSLMENFKYELGSYEFDVLQNYHDKIIENYMLPYVIDLKDCEPKIISYSNNISDSIFKDIFGNKTIPLFNEKDIFGSIDISLDLKKYSDLINELMYIVIHGIKFTELNDKISYNNDILNIFDAFLKLTFKKLTKDFNFENFHNVINKNKQINPYSSAPALSTKKNINNVFINSGDDSLGYLNGFYKKESDNKYINSGCIDLDYLKSSEKYLKVTINKNDYIAKMAMAMKHSEYDEIDVSFEDELPKCNQFLRKGNEEINGAKIRGQLVPLYNLTDSNIESKLQLYEEIEDDYEIIYKLNSFKRSDYYDYDVHDAIKIDYILEYKNLSEIGINGEYWTITERKYKVVYESKSYESYKFTDYIELKIAVDQWCKNEVSAKKTYGDISSWDVSDINDMSDLFAYKESFNSDISNWNTEKVTNMSRMFENAKSFNQRLNFNTEKVTDMRYMFSNAKSFNQRLNFNTEKVTDMNGMFYFAKSYNKSLNFDTNNVTDMKYMFFEATSFNQDLSMWCVPKITVMPQNFGLPENSDISPKWGKCPVNIFTKRGELELALDEWCKDDKRAMENYGDISSWDVSGITDMSFLFEKRINFNSDISNWNTSNATDMDSMFKSASLFNQPLYWDTSKVTNMSSMFMDASSFNQPLDFNTKNVTDMKKIFFRADSFNQPLTWDTSKVTDMYGMFYRSKSFNQPLDFNTEKVIHMSNMFFKASSFNQPLDWNTSNVNDMSDMFNGAIAFNQDLSMWCVPKITVMPQNFGLPVIFGADHMLKTHKSPNWGEKYCKDDTPKVSKLVKRENEISKIDKLFSFEKDILKINKFEDIESYKKKYKIEYSSSPSTMPPQPSSIEDKSKSLQIINCIDLEIKKLNLIFDPYDLQFFNSKVFLYLLSHPKTREIKWTDFIYNKDEIKDYYNTVIVRLKSFILAFKTISSDENLNEDLKIFFTYELFFLINLNQKNQLYSSYSLLSPFYDIKRYSLNLNITFFNIRDKIYNFMNSNQFFFEYDALKNIESEEIKLENSISDDKFFIKKRNSHKSEVSKDYFELPKSSDNPNSISFNLSYNDLQNFIEKSKKDYNVNIYDRKLNNLYKEYIYESKSKYDVLIKEITEKLKKKSINIYDKNSCFFHLISRYYRNFLQKTILKKYLNAQILIYFHTHKAMKILARAFYLIIMIPKKLKLKL